MLLVSRMGDGVLQNVLADCIGVHPAALVRTLDQAEAAGLLERRMVTGNRRLRAIHLQDAGQELAERLEKALNALRAEVLGSIPREDVETATRVKGHLGSNLGAVELTLALHRVFDSPNDLILWDTGHQAYVHKLVTGRRDGFDSLRQPGGLSG